MIARRRPSPGDPDYPVTPALQERLARQAELDKPPASIPRAGSTSNIEAPRSFSPTDKVLIRRVHSYMPVDALLTLLNDRLESDRGAGAQRYTREQLCAEIDQAVGASPTREGYDWAGLRKLLGAARASGVLEQIDEQTIDDFAVVFSLNAKQMLTLKDIVLGARRDPT